jgi:DnaJ-class molecular chaperone
MTPYCVLLAKPNDSDEVIRKLYHGLVRHCHPDAQRGLPEASKVKLTARWHEFTTAYSAIKTDALRSQWAASQFLLSGQCGKCAGSGVVGTRMFKGRIMECKECKGEGRLK